MRYLVKDKLVKYPPALTPDDIQTSTMYQVYNWCRQEFGDDERRGRWAFYSTYWSFRDEKDYVLFMLRWS